jgi:hypothetical protein
MLSCERPRVSSYEAGIWRMITASFLSVAILACSMDSTSFTIDGFCIVDDYSPHDVLVCLSNGKRLHLYGRSGRDCMENMPIVMVAKE